MGGQERLDSACECSDVRSKTGGELDKYLRMQGEEAMSDYKAFTTRLYEDQETIILEHGTSEITLVVSKSLRTTPVSFYLTPDMAEQIAKELTERAQKVRAQLEKKP
jgi:uncharacterized protein YlaI